MPVITAVFEKGVFRPLAPVVLAEGSEVQVDIPPAAVNGNPLARTVAEEAHIERVYEMLSRRFDGGEKEIAARHDEHQP